MRLGWLRFYPIGDAFRRHVNTPGERRRTLRLEQLPFQPERAGVFENRRIFEVFKACRLTGRSFHQTNMSGLFRESTTMSILALPPRSRRSRKFTRAPGPSPALVRCLQRTDEIGR